LRFAIAGALV